MAKRAASDMTPEDLKRWRERHGLSQLDASEKLGITSRMLIYYERGDFAIPAPIANLIKALEAV